MAHHVHLELVAPGVAQLLQRGDKQVATAAGAERQFGVLLHSPAPAATAGCLRQASLTMLLIDSSRPVFQTMKIG